jgi:hypothetical protein
VLQHDTIWCPRACAKKKREGIYRRAVLTEPAFWNPSRA